jgi:hypothetical protein
MPSPFAITAPSTSVVLAQNRLGEMPFTITNTTNQPLRGRVSIVPLDSAPATWFSLAGTAEVDLRPRATTQVLVRVEPPLGVPAGEHLFRVDVLRADTADPAVADAVTTGPSCSVVVPASVPEVNRWTVPRGYLATLVGASAGGALGELVIFLDAFFYLRSPSNKCSTFDCALGQVVFLILAVLVGLALLWVGSFIGAWAGLRSRKYLGSKLTALFLAVLMIPWTFAMLWLLSKVTDSFAVAAILAPILLTAVPGVLARGAVLLIRTRHI